MKDYSGTRKQFELFLESKRIYNNPTLNKEIFIECLRKDLRDLIKEKNDMKNWDFKKAFAQYENKVK